MEVYYGLAVSGDFNSKNYTLVSSKTDEPLVQYVNKNIDKYIGIILDNCNECINDEESIALAILNNSEVDIDHRKEYIRLLSTVIERIDAVLNKKMWNLLLQEKLVNYSENNILNYFYLSENGLDSFLIEFINDSNYNFEFDNNSINSNFGENSTSNFCNAIISCNDLTNERYEALLQALSMYYSSFSETGIEEDKVLILIKLCIIRMADSVLVFVRENYPDQLMQFITHNLDKYTDDVIN